MSGRIFLDHLRKRWAELRQFLWPLTPEERARVQARKEQYQLQHELTRRYERLVQRRQRIERLRDRLTRFEQRMAGLTNRVAECWAHDKRKAWQLALSLDELRRRAERLRARLQHHEQSYKRQRLRFEDKKRQLHARTLGRPF